MMKITTTRLRHQGTKDSGGIEPRQKKWRSTVAGALLAVVTAFLLAPATGAAQTYEQPPTLRASEILPANLVQGADFRVKEEVVNDGVLNIYTIDTSFGEMKAVSTAKLRQRVSEVIALRQMETVRQSDTFSKSIVESGKDTIGTVEGVVTDPVGTVSGAVSGVSKAFARAGEALFGSKRSEAEDSRFDSLIGLSKTKRDYAFDFGVDVYSDNEILQERLDELARASYAGGLVYSAALSMVPGAAGLAVTATGMTHLTNEIYKTTAPTDLRRMNREKLMAMGVRLDAVDHFIDNAKFSPRDQTELVFALEKMPEAKQRELFIVLATLTSDRDMAFFRQRQAQMYAGYHRALVPIDGFFAFGEFVGAHNSKGSIVFNLPLDYLVWTEWMANAVVQVDQTIATMQGVSGKELVIAGSLSPYARQQLAERGWTVTDNAEQVIATK